VRRWHIAERWVAAALFAAGVILPAAALARRRADPPITLLFVSRRCPACQRAAARLDTAQLLVADSGNWPHARVVYDSSHVLSRALGIAAVPALVTVTAVVRYDFAR
jgi:thioredoxin-like negative regulator of GroEL